MAKLTDLGDIPLQMTGKHTQQVRGGRPAGDNMKACEPLSGDCGGVGSNHARWALRPEG
jgi:hypothetical protein